MRDRVERAMARICSTHDAPLHRLESSRAQKRIARPCSQ